MSFEPNTQISYNNTREYHLIIIAQPKSNALCLFCSLQKQLLNKAASKNLQKKQSLSHFLPQQAAKCS